MHIPQELKYSREHEWVQVNGNTCRVGITDYAQQSLGDVVFVELPEIGRVLERGEAFGVVESVKAASDCYSPLAGTVTAVNQELLDTPQLINEDPYGRGWIMEVEIANPDQLEGLLTAVQYEELVREGGA